jgi:hypothetical protein
VNGGVTTFHAIVEGTPYWFAAAIPRAINFLLTIFFQLFSVYQVVRTNQPAVMTAVLHLIEDISYTC